MAAQAPLQGRGAAGLRSGLATARILHAATRPFLNLRCGKGTTGERNLKPSLQLGTLLPIGVRQTATTRTTSAFLGEGTSTVEVASQLADDLAFNVAGGVALATAQAAVAQLGCFHDD